jgi:hypothetical protein
MPCTLTRHRGLQQQLTAGWPYTGPSTNWISPSEPKAKASYSSQHPTGYLPVYPELSWNFSRNMTGFLTVYPELSWVFSQNMTGFLPVYPKLSWHFSRKSDQRE